jgi:HEAT repeat protein
MKYRNAMHWLLLAGFAAAPWEAAIFAADEADEDTIAMVVGLLNEKDKDLRNLGLQQVREAVKGSSATRKFAALLPRMTADAQVSLLDALGDRGDAAARPAVLEMLKSQDGHVRLAALRALGSLGDKTDVSQLARTLSTGAEAEKAAARAGLIRLQGQGINAAIAAELKPATPPLRVEIVRLLTTRRAVDNVPDILTLAKCDDAEVRAAAMVALGELAGPEHVAGMLQGLLAGRKGPERDAAEKAVVMVCNRIQDANKRAEPFLAALANFGGADRTALLPALGRIGGREALKIAEETIADTDPSRHAAGVRALCNWPDASICTRLMQLAKDETDADLRKAALRALIRVAALPDKRPNAEKLALLKSAMEMTGTTDERNYLIQRCQAIRTIESLRFVVPYLEQPGCAQSACATVVDLARHRELREPNKPEFDRALDAVIRISKDRGLIDRANRYKQGKT